MDMLQDQMLPRQDDEAQHATVSVTVFDIPTSSSAVASACPDRSNKAGTLQKVLVLQRMEEILHHHAPPRY